MTEPQPVDYRTKGSGGPPSREPFLALFLLGLAGGVVISAAVWSMAFSADPRGTDKFWGVLYFAIPMGKCFLAGIMSINRRGRGAAAGMLVSIALGLLIFGWEFISHCRI